MISPFAHAAHWSTAVVYLAPMAVIAAFAVRDNIRRRRAKTSHDPGEER